MAKRKKGKTAAKVKKVVRQLWSSKDVRLLRNLATRHPAQKIADALGRSVLALRYKAHILGISLRPKQRAVRARLAVAKRKK